MKVCSAKITTDAACVAVLHGTLDHIHEVNVQKLERQILRTACKRKATDQISERPSKIISSELVKMDEDNLQREDIKRVRQSVYRERRKLFPAQPKNREEFHNILENIGFITSKDENFVLANDSESGIVILGCEANLKFLCSDVEFFADGTFKCCPKYFAQLYTIHGFKNGHYIPLVFCLLPSKSGDCYRKMFELLQQCCQQFNLTLKVETIHLDFEERMHTVIRELYPNVVIKSCRFHLGQSWWRKIQNLGLAKEYKRYGSEISKWLIHFFGLAFLDPEDVSDSFSEDLIPDMPSNRAVEQFSDYVLATYIDDTAMFPPSTWAEVPSTVRRTNNGPEAFHAHYNEQFYNSHPSMFIFMDTLEKIQATTYVKLRSTSAPAIRTRKDMEKEHFLIEKFNQLKSGELTRRQFVYALSYKFKPLVK